MRPNINVFVYRPSQVLLAKRSTPKNTLHFVRLAPNQSRQLGLMVIAALVIGLGLTHFIHIRIAELGAKVDQLQISNTVIADKNNRLVAAGAQEASQAQVVAMAKRKLKLFEPDQAQVRRISL